MKHQILPRAQVDILKKALSALEDANSEHLLYSDDTVNDDINNEQFDIKVLRGMLKSQVTINLTDEEVDCFTHRNDVDYPIYID